MSDRFGPFELERLLGRGGMAEAFLATRADGDKSTPLVLKRIRPDHAHREEYLKRFVFEAQVASRLQHKNLVRFVEFGRVGDCHYIAMQKVRGWSLHRLLDAVFLSAPPPLEVGLAIAIGLLDGLSQMHAVTDENGHPRPMLHRDVTPSNVIIADDGRPVIIDFGITKDIFGPSLTLPGKVIGTARYMSPEHRKAEYLDPRADVYSASVILFELLFGRHPWPPLSSIKELLRVSFDPPELTDADKQRLPEPLIEILFRGLACDREQRYLDAQAMRDALLGLAPTLPSWERSAEQVIAWAKGLGVPLDEDLSSPVVDLKPPEGDESEVVWAADGSLTTGEESAASLEATNSDVLPLPPLPPRRDSSLVHSATEDLLAAATLPSRPMWVWPMVGLGGMALVGVVVVYLLSH